MRVGNRALMVPFLMSLALLAFVVCAEENQAPKILSTPYAVPAALTTEDSTDLCVFASDDALSNGVLKYTWSKVSGPGEVEFAENNGGVTGSVCEATFSAAGSYTLAVEVSDGDKTTKGQVLVEVALSLVTEAVSRETGIGVPIDTYVSLAPQDDGMTTAYEPGQVPVGFLVNRSGDLNKVVTVFMRLSGTAVPVTDYTFASPVFSLSSNIIGITIRSGELFGVVTLIPAADNLAEGNETVTLTIVNSLSYQTTSNGNAITATISELPQVSVVTRGHAAEPAQAGKFDIVRSGGNGTLTVRYTVSGTATAGVDYAALSGAVIIPAGSNAASVFVNVKDDTLREVTENVRITLTPDAKYALDVYKNGASLKIRDNDNPTVIISDINNEASEPGTNTGGVTFTRFGRTDVALTANYTVGGSATNGVDYVYLSGKVTFAIGASTASIQIKVKDDTLREGFEGVQITLATGTGYQIEAGDSAYISIIDND